jgi:hypothetical protein
MTDLKNSETLEYILPKNPEPCYYIEDQMIRNEPIPEEVVKQAEQEKKSMEDQSKELMSGYYELEELVSGIEPPCK